MQELVLLARSSSQGICFLCVICVLLSSIGPQDQGLKALSKHLLQTAPAHPLSDAISDFPKRGLMVSASYYSLKIQTKK